MYIIFKVWPTSQCLLSRLLLPHRHQTTMFIGQYKSNATDICLQVLYLNEHNTKDDWVTWSYTDWREVFPASIEHFPQVIQTLIGIVVLTGLQFPSNYTQVQTIAYSFLVSLQASNIIMHQKQIKRYSKTTWQLLRFFYRLSRFCCY